MKEDLVVCGKDKTHVTGSNEIHAGPVERIRSVLCLCLPHFGLSLASASRGLLRRSEWVNPCEGGWISTGQEVLGLVCPNCCGSIGTQF